MATIEEMQSSMTLFYSKRTGEIKSLATGIQDMSYFGDDSQDYSLIWNFVVINIDENVIKNPQMFKVNIETKLLEMKPDAVSQYPIAQS